MFCKFVFIISKITSSHFFRLNIILLIDKAYNFHCSKFYFGGMAVLVICHYMIKNRAFSAKASLKIVSNFWSG